VYVGALELDVLLGDVHSLKEKRSLVRLSSPNYGGSTRCRPAKRHLSCTGER